MRRLLDVAQATVIFTIFVVLVVCVTWQVVTRYVLGVPSTVTDEIARFLFIWLALFGGAYTYGKGRHLAIDMLPMLLTGRARAAVEICITLLVGGFAAAVLVWGGYDLVARTLERGQISPSLRLPMGYVYMALPVSGLIILGYALANIVSILRGHTPAHDDPMTPVE